MNLAADFASGRLIVFLSGELDQHEARKTSERLRALLEEYLPRDCVLELSGLSFMDSAGIAVIIKASRQIKLIGGRLWIENPVRQVLRVIEASGIDRLVPVKSSIAGGLT